MFTVSSLHHPFLYFKLASSLSSTSGPEGSPAVAALVDAVLVHAVLVHHPQSLVLQPPSLDEHPANVNSQLGEVDPHPSLQRTSSRGLCLATWHLAITLMEVALLSVAQHPDSDCPAGGDQPSVADVQVRDDGLHASGSQQEMHLDKE